jgi:hypothetical protein
MLHNYLSQMVSSAHCSAFLLARLVGVIYATMFRMDPAAELS